MVDASYPSRKNRWIWLGGGLILAAAIVYGAYTLPLGRTRVLLTENQYGKQTILLIPGKTVSQSFQAEPHISYSGIMLYSTLPILHDQKLHVTIKNNQGAVLSSGDNLRTSYRGADDTLRITVQFPWVRVDHPQLLKADITLENGTVLPLKISPRNIDKHGQAWINDVKQPGDFVFAVIKATPLDFGTRQGVLAAVIFMLGLFTIYAFFPPRWHWWAAAALVFCITPLALLGFWYSDGVLGIADWDYYFSLHESYRVSLLQYHTFPIWNPYTCGGTAGLADPEFSVFSPMFIFELLFGVPIGVRIAIFFSVAIGAVGMLLLGKQLRLSLGASLLAAVISSFGSVTLLEIVEGHVNVFAAMWIPWIFWTWLRAYQAPDASRGVLSFLKPTSATLLCSLFLALTFLRGGIYLLMYTSLAFIFITLASGNIKKAFRITLVSGLWALGFSAIKLIPVLSWLKQFPDESYASSTYTLPWLIEILFGRYRHGTYLLFEQNSGWHEYGSYIGWPAFLLALVSLTQWRRSRFVRVLAVGAIITVLVSATGPALKPFFDAIPYIPRSNISRIILFAVLPIGLLAGRGLDRLTAVVGKRGLVLAPVVVGIVAIDLMSFSYAISEQAFVLPDVFAPIPHAPYPLAFTRKRYDLQGQETRTTRSYAAARVGYGTLTYCSVLGPGANVITVEDEGDSSIITTSPPAQNVTLLAWSPQVVTAIVQAETPTSVTLNTNYATGWYANGKPAEVMSNRVSTTIPPGVHRVTFTYHQPGLWAGIIITTGSIITGAYNVDRARRRYRASRRVAETVQSPAAVYSLEP